MKRFTKFFMMIASVFCGLAISGNAIGQTLVIAYETQITANKGWTTNSSTGTSTTKTYSQNGCVFGGGGSIAINTDASFCSTTGAINMAGSNRWIDIPAITFVNNAEGTSAGTISVTYYNNGGGRTVTVYTQDSQGLSSNGTSVGTSSSGTNKECTAKALTLPAISGSKVLRISVGGNLDIQSIEVKTYSSGPSLSTSTTSLTGFTYQQENGPSVSQSFNLSGALLVSGDITITGSANYEVSIDNAVFSASAIVSATAETLAATPVYVRLKAGLPTATYNNEEISIAGAGVAAPAKVICSGTVTPPPTPTLIPSTVSISGLGYVENAVSTVKTFTIQGSNLDAGDITVSLPAGSSYELSTDAFGIAGLSSLSITQANLSTTTVSIRLQSGLAINTYSDVISISGGNAPAVSINLSGAVTKAPLQTPILNDATDITENGAIVSWNDVGADSYEVSLFRQTTIKSWDFTGEWSINATTTDDNLLLDTSSGDNQNKRFEYLPATSSQELVYKDGTKISDTEGLKFTAGAASTGTPPQGKIRLGFGVGKIFLNGANIVVDIPCSAGNVVTLIGTAGNSTAIDRGFSVNGGTLNREKTSGSISASGIMTVAGGATGAWVYNATGTSLKLTTVTGGMNVQKILVQNIQNIGVHPIAGTETSKEFTDLDAAVEYTYTVKAIRNSETSISDSKTFTTTNPTAIKAVSVADKIVAVKYYTISGIEVNESAKGIIIVKTIYQDGSITASKTVK